MINHARTLLINVAGTTSQRQDAGEEYIPPEFAPVTLPSYLLSARRLLLGASPDRYFLNFRVRELMRYLHQTELADYVYALDPRVTYWPEQSVPTLLKDEHKTVELITGPADTQLFFTGQLVADNARGRCLNEIVASVVSDGPDVVLRIEQPGRSAIDNVLTVVNNLSDAVPFGQTGLQVRISKPTPGSLWRVTTVAKPASAITGVLPLLEIIGEPTLLELFGVLTTTEPYATFKNLWADNKTPVYRLCGFTLAMIYRTDEVRKNGNNG